MYEPVVPMRAEPRLGDADRLLERDPRVRSSPSKTRRSANTSAIGREPRACAPTAVGDHRRAPARRPESRRCPSSASRGSSRSRDRPASDRCRPVTARTSKGSMPSTSATMPTSTSSEPWPISVAPQNTVTPPLRSSLSCTPECGRSFQLIGSPAPDRYDEQARPTPRPCGSLRNLSLPPDRSTTRRMQSDEPDGADPHVIRGQRSGGATMPSRKLGGIDRELLGDLVELHFLAEPRLRRAVAALRVRTAACS